MIQVREGPGLSAERWTMDSKTTQWTAYTGRMIREGMLG